METYSEMIDRHIREIKDFRSQCPHIHQSTRGVFEGYWACDECGDFIRWATQEEMLKNRG